MFGENSSSKKKREGYYNNEQDTDVLTNPRKEDCSFNIDYMTAEELQKEADEKHADKVKQSQQNN